MPNHGPRRRVAPGRIANVSLVQCAKCPTTEQSFVGIKEFEKLGWVYSRIEKWVCPQCRLKLRVCRICGGPMPYGSRPLECSIKCKKEHGRRYRLERRPITIEQTRKSYNKNKYKYNATRRQKLKTDKAFHEKNLADRRALYRRRRQDPDWVDKRRTREVGRYAEKSKDQEWLDNRREKDRQWQIRRRELKNLEQASKLADELQERSPSTNSRKYPPKRSGRPSTPR